MEILRLPEQDPFVAGTNEITDIPTNQIVKLEGATILFCHSGMARLEVDLQSFEIVENTQVVLLPGSIISCSYVTDDFSTSYVDFTKSLFEEITSRLNPPFFRFLKEHPCIIVPQERVKPIIGLTLAMEDLYKDRENSFRLQIFKNYVQNFLLDFYDKNQHLFLQKKPKGVSRQEEIFKRFIHLIHKYCMTQREVSFYAAELFITPRYLSSIVQNVTDTTAKSIIDRHVILEIKALLQSTNFSIQEIANQCQFPDQSFFGRYFKKHTGVSPLNYRRKFD